MSDYIAATEVQAV